jgi:glyoxylase I family protein
MQIEHVAWQVKDPVALAEWYTQHLGFQVVRKVNGPALTHFLADASGRVIIEIYCNPAASIPEYPTQSPLILHLAFTVPNIVETRDRLLKAGATLAEDIVTTPDGDNLVMLRDPWGFPIQLVKRRNPMLPGAS